MKKITTRTSDATSVRERERERERCPLNSNCLINNVIYKAAVRKKDACSDNNDNNERIYNSATELN